MAMSDAAKQVLEENKKAMSAAEIYDEIIQKELYKFGAKNPKGVLSQAMRERSTANAKAKVTMFRLVSPGIYELNSNVN